MITNIITTWRKEIPVTEGPFKFSYIAVYKIDGGKRKLISFNTNSFLSIRSFDQRQKENLIKKHGARAYAIAHSIAKKIENKYI
jgi:hypothetical protein